MPKKYIIAIGVALAVLAAGFVAFNRPAELKVESGNGRSSDAASPAPGSESGDKFVVAHPFNLDQIASFSKYRSCMGHSYSGQTVAGGEEPHNRSLKHYITPLASVRESGEEIPIYAPFDGEISDVTYSEPEGDYQVWVTPNPTGIKQWHFIFFHVLLDEGFAEGSAVAAGERIGRAHLNLGGNFDIGMKRSAPFSRPAISPPFEHFSDAILADYEARGVTVADITIPKEYRDANPCAIIPGSEGVDARFLPGSGEREQVVLE
ncbi:MAG: hypothetical protein HYS45_00125 [Parcubacteria group bacterium]|nr:hypothetical protein [Parcubacteria group bacterium]